MSNLQKNDVVNLLERYKVCERFVSSQEYATTYFGITADQVNDYRKIMDFVEILIASIAPSDESTLLRLRYIKGLSVEKCAECMSLSRSTGFRLLKRAKDKVYAKYKEAKGENKD